MDAAVELWLGFLEPSTRESYMYIWEPFMRWLGEEGGPFRGMGPSELVEWQRSNPGCYDFVDVVERYVRGLVSYRASSKVQVLAVVRSFFLYNRAELPRDRRFKVRSDVPKVVGTLSAGDVRRIVETSNPMYRAVWLCMGMGFLDIQGLLYWSDHGLEATQRQLREGQTVVRIDLPGRKRVRNKRSYYTFVGRDAVDALRMWLRQRPRVDHDAIFVTQFGTPLTESALRRYWMLRLDRLGLVERKEDGFRGNRYGKNIHELRDVFRSRWTRSGQDAPVAEFFMGHDIDKLGYDKSPWHYPEWYEEKYLEAEPWLNIVSEDPERVPIGDIRKMQRRYEKAIGEIREELEYLKGLVGERR